ncbi:hypothetical protein WJX84_007490 [Apatococcus fuscideae]|uniref:Galactose oxidase n=1 Tax=Apatococcus fuscideae TaxID=2026836 RepID=A0AAW1T485_9CHLO
MASRAPLSAHRVLVLLLWQPIKVKFQIIPREPSFAEWAEFTTSDRDLLPNLFPTHIHTSLSLWRKSYDSDEVCGNSCFGTLPNRTGLPGRSCGRKYNYTTAGQTAGAGQTTVNPNAQNNATGTFAVAAVATPVAASGSWNVVGNSGSIAIHFLLFTNNQALVMQRPDLTNPNPYLLAANGDHEIAAVFNVQSNTFVPFHITESPFCSGHLIMPNGQGLIAGGDNVDLMAPFLTNGFFSIRIFNPFGPSYSLGPNMPTGRWYPTLATLPDGTILIVGGAQAEGGGYGGGCSIPDNSIDNPSYIIYNPISNSLSGDVPFAPLAAAWPINLYPFVAVLPNSGSVLVIVGASIGAYVITAGGYTADAAWGAPASLPVPICYPQTATVSLQPLSAANNWAPQVLVVGGSSSDCAGPTTPSSATSYLINASPGANHAPVPEAMPVPRVMGDCVVLPDGTTFCCNGALAGIAGGGPGYGQATGGATAGTIYDPSRPVGSRWRQVADSQILRFYHSVATLTQNAEVLVAGSEATVDYRVQIFTPPYLQGGAPRPTIGSAPNVIVPGTTFTIAFSNVDTIDRVVLSKLAAVTHGNHMDARQLVLACTAAGTSTTCTAPPDATVAPSGQYLLFILRNGVPSIGQYVFVTQGSATSAGNTTTGTTVAIGPPTLNSGTYTIQSVGRTCRPFVSVSGLCSDTLIDTWFTNDGSGRQIFSLQQPQAGVNSYTIEVTAGRNTCGGYNFFSMQPCGGNTNPDLWNVDDGSGRQRFAVQAVPNVAGQFYIIALGRPGGCGTYLSAPACSSADLLMRFAVGDDMTGDQRFILTPTAPIAGSAITVGPPPLPSGTYTFSNVGKTCRPFASLSGDCSNVNIDSWFVQDGSGRQIFNLQLLPTGTNTYTITTTSGRAGCGTPFWSMQACGGSTTATLAATDDGTGLERWSIVPVNGQAGQYYIIGAGRSACANVLGYSSCASSNLLNMFYPGDDGTGLQRFTIAAQAAPAATAANQPLANGNYEIVVAAGRQNCEQYLLGPGCADVNPNPIGGPLLEIDADPRSVWTVTLVAGSTNRYTLVSTNRATCNSFLSGAGCPNPIGNAVAFFGSDDGSGNQEWTLTPAPNNFGVYDVQCSGRATCANYLSVQQCDGTIFPDLYFMDDSSGRQQWRFVPA